LGVEASFGGGPLDSVVNWQLDHGSNASSHNGELHSLVCSKASFLDIGSIEALESRLVDALTRERS